MESMFSFIFILLLSKKGLIITNLKTSNHALKFIVQYGCNMEF